MKFYIYPPPPVEKEKKFLPGQNCFITLRSDKDTGRAKVIDGPISAEADKFRPKLLVQDEKENHKPCQKKNRFRVKYDSCGSEYHVNAAKIDRVYDDFPSVIITRETLDFRRLARSQVVKSDRVVDLGCSVGLCTKILSEHCDHVLGLDISEEAIEKAKKNYPHLNFEQVDVLRHLTSLQQKLQGYNKVFVDIGGNRQVPALVRILFFVMEKLGPQLLVVKSQVLYDSAIKYHSINDNNYHESKDEYEGILPNQGGIEWWKDLFEKYSQIPGVSNRPESWFLQGKKVNFEGLHPFHFPWRETLNSVPVCRLYNYATCDNPKCTFDHTVCHHCGEQGHIASIHSPTAGIIVDAGKFQNECENLVNMMHIAISQETDEEENNDNIEDENIFDQKFVYDDDKSGFRVEKLIESFFSDPIKYKLLEDSIPDVMQASHVQSRKRPKKRALIEDDDGVEEDDDDDADDKENGLITDESTAILTSKVPSRSVPSSPKSGASSRDAVVANLSSMLNNPDANDLATRSTTISTTKRIGDYIEARDALLVPLAKASLESFLPANRTLNADAPRTEPHSIFSHMKPALSWNGCKFCCDNKIGLVSQSKDFSKSKDFNQSKDFTKRKVVECEISANELVFNIRFSFPGKPHQKMQEFKVLGSQTLADLREKIYCLQDRIFEVGNDAKDGNNDQNTSKEVIQDEDNVSGKDSTPRLVDLFRNRKIRESAFFFIEGCFYNDLSSPSHIDYSRDIITWLNAMPVSSSPCYSTLQSSTMDSVKFKDLNLRTKHPYLFYHRGNCEHIMIVTEIRRFHESLDLNLLHAYPVCTFLLKAKRKRCKICESGFATLVSFNDPMCPESPTIMCETCFELLHGDGIGPKSPHHQVCKYIQI